MSCVRGLTVGFFFSPTEEFVWPCSTGRCSISVRSCTPDTIWTGFLKARDFTTYQKSCCSYIMVIVNPRHVPLGLFLCVCKMLHKNMELYTQYRSLNFEYKSVFSHINFREIYCFVNSKNGVCAFSCCYPPAFQPLKVPSGRDPVFLSIWKAARTASS